MKRRTGRNHNGDAYFEKCFYEPCNGEGASERCDDCDFLSDVCEDLAHYEELEESLRKAFGGCDGLLDEIVNSFVRHATAEAKEELKGAGKVRILTDEDADKWLRWKELDKDGKLIELPCKPGDIVFVKMKNGGLLKAEVVGFTYFDSYGFCVSIAPGYLVNTNIPFSEFGKTIFLP